VLSGEEFTPTHGGKIASIVIRRQARCLLVTYANLFDVLSG
jgi:hypothetical protein